jgi:hypothetical protein
VWRSREDRSTKLCLRTNTKEATGVGSKLLSATAAEMRKRDRRVIRGEDAQI